LKLIVGLGNPGAKYARNRHNIGFMALDEIASAHGFSPWRAKFQGQVSEGRLGTTKAILLKPETFMNLSGQSVGEAARFHKIDPAEVIVFHDELDLAPGKIRVKTGGGHAGHNGLRSIHAHIGADYDRVRMGVGHPGHKDAVAGYVLHDFHKADADWPDHRNQHQSRNRKNPLLHPLRIRGRRCKNWRIVSNDARAPLGCFCASGGGCAAVAL